MVAKALAGELGSSNIRVNSISPAFIETNQTRTAREYTTKAAGDLMNTAPPLGRIGQPDEVSPAAIYLLSDASAYTTGSVSSTSCPPNWTLAISCSYLGCFGPKSSAIHPCCCPCGQNSLYRFMLTN